MTEPDFVSAALGGLLIGAGAVLLMVTTGRIAGISGMISGLLPPYGDGQAAVRLAFLAGLVAAPWIYSVLAGSAVAVEVTSNPALLMSAGLLVGFGTALGRGCTSGHGVCGIARLSPRSLVATAMFMLTAGITVFLMRHAIGG